MVFAFTSVLGTPAPAAAAVATASLVESGRMWWNVVEVREKNFDPGVAEEKRSAWAAALGQ